MRGGLVFVPDGPSRATVRGDSHSGGLEGQHPGDSFIHMPSPLAGMAGRLASARAAHQRT